jgi:hypothetical protein
MGTSEIFTKARIEPNSQQSIHAVWSQVHFVHIFLHDSSDVRSLPMLNVLAA